MNYGKQAPKAVRCNTHKTRNPYRGVTAEISLKLVLSWAIAIGAIASFFRLLPYHLTQRAKLKELHIQVQETDTRVTKLREQLNHNFDPQQTQSLMEQYSTLTTPDRSRIYWLKDNEQ
jgi:hypothetical protein